MTTYTAEQITRIGGKSWTSRDGRITRIYISGDVIASLLDLDVDRYRSGRISSATLAGENISNAEAGRILDSKAYLQDGELTIQTASRHEDEIADAIAAAVAATEPAPVEQPAEAPTAPADVIAALRSAGRTVRQIAAAIGCAVSTVYRWARGMHRPSARYATVLAALAA